ncbi:MAG: aminotransferase class I/II-fold pyridoxal phosphate-dependent enzyme [Ramlibacter sp.]|jgi:histidinol-phosphate/aromatic aminotransferase/cobyric acid decarboxylase-like protein/choline kinase|nr:aminotransferase class I/II-fold pyridoxal phosphate-dependent enzyme [Ramlibacter sp.]
MKAVILAAGYGNRMRPLTDHLHKTLIKVGERTIIDRIIDGLLENGVHDIVIALGYRADELREHVTGEHGARCNFQFVVNERYRETNNIHSLALVFEQCDIDDDILLIESDLLYEPAVLRLALDSPHPNLALVDRYRSGMDGTVLALDGERVASVIPPHLQGAQFDFSDKFKTLNIYRFSREFCRSDFRKILTYYASTIDDNCYYELILGILIYMKRGEIHAASVEGLRWAEVDDPNDLRIAEFMFEPTRQRAILDESWGGYWSYAVTDFAFIRNMHFPPPSVFSEIRNNLAPLLQNYGSAQAVLNQKLAYLQLQPVQTLVLLNGASQVFPILGACFAGKKALIPAPGFGEYARIFPGADTYADNGADYGDQLEAGLARSPAQVVVVTNPNNPTGSVIPTGRLLDCIRRHRDRFFLVDESFIDFSGERPLEEAAETGLDNFMVIKSLSKVLGVPGVRLGYVFSHNRKLLDTVSAAIPIWNSNSVAEFLLEVLLKQRRAFAESVRQTVQDRESFAQALRANPTVQQVFDSGANFLLVRLAMPATQLGPVVAQLLAGHAIYVKDISPKFGDGRAWLRLAVRTSAENERFVRALAAVCAG